MTFAGKQIDGREVRVDISTPRPEKKQNGGGGGRVEAPTSAPSATLFVGNLSFNASEDSVHAFFSAHGEVSNVRLPTDRETGNPKG